MRIHYKLSLKLMSTFIFCIASPLLFANQMDCKTTHVKFKNALALLNVNAKKPLRNKVYFIKNISPNSIWLNHPQNKDAHAGAGWSTLLKPGNGSALLLSKKNFSLNCSQVANEKIHYFACRDVLRICETNINAHEEEAESYWLVENVLWDKLPKAVDVKLEN